MENAEVVTPPVTEVVDPPKPKHYAEQYQKKINDLAGENESLKKKIQEAEELKMQETNQHKELYEREKKKRELAEESEKNLKQSYLVNFKLSAIKTAAIKEGIHDSAIDDLAKLDNDVQVEFTSLGNVNVVGVDEYIASLKQNKSYLFKKLNAPTINNQSPNSITEMSMDDLLKLEKDDPNKYRALMKEKLDKRRNNK